MKRAELKKLPIKRRRDKANGKTWRGYATSCNDAMINEFSSHIAKMVPPTTVCEILGISIGSYQYWKRMGGIFEQAIESGAKPNPAHEIFYKFMCEERLAQGAWKLQVINRSLLPDAFTPAWVRDMTILERRDRKNWGRKDFLEAAENEDYTPDEEFL